MKFKKPDLITSLLVLFLVATPLLMFFLTTVKNNVQLFSTHVASITKLEMLDKDFNYFATQKGNFVNYDEVNSQIKDFENIIFDFKSSIEQDIVLSRFSDDILQIEEDFSKKVVLLEHVKSYNSIVANSLNYLVDLKDNIANKSNLTSEDLQLIDNTLFRTMGFYTDIYHNKEQLLNNIEDIRVLADRENNDYISYFYQHEKSIVDRVLTIQKEQKDVQNLHIFKKLSDLYGQLQEFYLLFLKIGGVVKNILLLFIMVLVSSILYLHKKSLKDKKELIAYKYAIENSDNSIVITNLDSKIVYVNEAFERETGYKKEEVIGEDPRILQSGLMDKSHYENMYEDLINKKRWEGEFINKRKNGTIYYEKASIIPIMIDDKVTNYIAIKLNVTKYIEQEKKVEFLAFHDGLTSLPNRLHLEHYFKNTIIKDGKKVALFYMDLDGFKTINDSLGHHIGDKLLKVFATRLQYLLSKNDFISRIGGDEFIAIINIENIEDITNVAQRILDSFESSIRVDEHSLNITTSIGISLFPNDGKTLDDLMKYADTAMYKAKANGRNGFEFFTKELFAEQHDRLNIEQELQNALKNDEFYLVYQPKYDLTSNDILGFEALIRWENEKLGFVPPDKFIFIAEELGLINEIGYFVFEQACIDFLALKEINPNLKSIAINVSTIQFKQKDFLINLNALCEKIGIASSSIELEVTETYIMENVEKNIQTLYELREHGYKIAIDDFGTGYSSFSYLKKLPINTIKIDKAFVDDICIKKRDKAIANTIIALADNLGFNTVAEGIEYKDQEVLLKKMGCQIGQGYLFSKPQKLEELKKFVYNKDRVKEIEYSIV